MDAKTLQKIKEIFESYPEVKLAYFFGSRSRGEGGVLSDYDFAVYFDARDAVRRYDILFKLTADILKILKTDKLDVISINDTDSPLFKYQVISEGKLIVEREPFRLLLEPRILNEYFDHKFLLKKHNLTKV